MIDERIGEVEIVAAARWMADRMVQAAVGCGIEGDGGSLAGELEPLAGIYAQAFETIARGLRHRQCDVMTFPITLDGRPDRVTFCLFPGRIGAILGDSPEVTVIEPAGDATWARVHLRGEERPATVRVSPATLGAMGAGPSEWPQPEAEAEAERPRTWRDEKPML